jgi:DNA-binding NarL/FixJ family response regulator
VVGDWEDLGVSRTVLIVDDHAGFRRMARRVLEAGGLTIVGEAEDAASAICAARVLDPEVVLLDVLLPDGDGFAVAEAIAQLAGRARIVLTSSRDLEDLRTRLAQTSACGFLAKRDLSGDALIAIAARAP